MKLRSSEAVDCTMHWEKGIENATRRYQDFKAGKRDEEMKEEEEKGRDVEEMDRFEDDGEGKEDESGMVDAYEKGRRGQKREAADKKGGERKKNKNGEGN